MDNTAKSPMTMHDDHDTTSALNRRAPAFRPLGLLGLVGLLAGSTACDAEVDDVAKGMGATLAKAPLTKQPVASLVAPQPGGVALRYVALVNKAAEAPCPPAMDERWGVEHLLRQGAVAAMMEGALLPKPLERFCEYSWEGAQAPTSAPSFTPAITPSIVRIDPDLDVVVPQAQVPIEAASKEHSKLEPEPTPLPLPGGTLSGYAHLGGDAEVLKVLSGAFQRAVGATPGAPVPTPKNSAIVAVVDSVGPSQAGGAYGSAARRLQHGLAMAELIRDVRCPKRDADCTAQLFHAQAFPYSGGDPAPQPSGGPLGSQASLARAMTETILTWRKNHVPKKTRLIINLSLGWDARYGGALTADPDDHMDLLNGTNTKVPAPVQAVHAVTAWASCNQALMIAAAGNNAGATCEETGAMAPALWERYPAPTRKRCHHVFGSEAHVYYDDPEGKRGAGALVYAAGGLTYADEAIPNARAGSLPARATPAFQAVARTGAGYTGSWTGTSVATAAVSAIAARLWGDGHGHGLSPHEIMQKIDTSGSALPMTAALHPAGQAAPSVARISAHDAYARLCPGCANPYGAQGPSDALALVDSQFTSTTLADATPINSGGGVVQLSCASTQVACGVAGNQTVTRCAGAGATQAASGASDPLEPWVRPQPDVPLCPVCPVKRKKLKLSLDPAYTGGAITLSDPELSFTLPTTGELVAVTLQNVTVGSTPVDVDLQQFRVQLATGLTLLGDLLTQQGVRSGELRFTVPDATGAPAQLTSAVSVHN